MRILLVSEGRHEQGGALEALVRRLLPASEISFIKKSVKDVARVHGQGEAFFKKGLSAIRLAADEGCEALVFVIDQDGDRDRERQLDRAQEQAAFSIRRAFGIAIRTFDAWMPADEAALTKVFQTTVDRQKSPERLPDPKKVFVGLMKSHLAKTSQSDLYRRVSEYADPVELEKRCPKGFKPFAQRVRSFE